MDLLQRFTVPWLFSRTLLSNLNIFLKCMRFIQHVSCSNFAPATDVNVEILQDRHGEPRHVLGRAVDPGSTPGAGHTVPLRSLGGVRALGCPVVLVCVVSVCLCAQSRHSQPRKVWCAHKSHPCPGRELQMRVSGLTFQQVRE